MTLITLGSERVDTRFPPLQFPANLLQESQPTTQARPALRSHGRHCRRNSSMGSSLVIKSPTRARIKRRGKRMSYPAMSQASSSPTSQSSPGEQHIGWTTVASFSSRHFSVVVFAAMEKLYYCSTPVAHVFSPVASVSFSLRLGLARHGNRHPQQIYPLGRHCTRETTSCACVPVSSVTIPRSCFAKVFPAFQSRCLCRVLCKCSLAALI